MLFFFPRQAPNIHLRAPHLTLAAPSSQSPMVFVTWELSLILILRWPHTFVHHVRRRTSISAESLELGNSCHA